MLLLSSRDTWWMGQCDAALEALGYTGDWQPVEGHPQAYDLHIPDGAADTVAAMLSELLAEELLRAEAPPSDGTVASQVNIFWRPAFATALSSAVLLLVFHTITGDAGHGSVWHAHGGLMRPLVLQGHQWFRLITAATLHADVGHALSNAGFIVALGWAAGERLGSGTALAVWLATAVAGFGVSLAGTDIVSTIGASGGLFGLLGCAAGHALRHVDTRRTPRRRVQVLGAALMLLAMTAFNPEANRWAHVGGFVMGLALGAVLPRWGRWIQALLAAAVAAILLIAWICAWQVNGGSQMD